MNGFIKIKRLASSSIGSKNPSSNINIRLKYKKNTLSKILKDVKYITYKNFDKNPIINYNDKIFLNKPKTASRSLRYFNDMSGSGIYDNENILPKDYNKMKISQQNKPIWNYSYFFNDKNKKIMKHNYSAKKIRIKKLINLKDPCIIEDWQKPRMIKILEKNSLIEEEIMLKPWKFFPNIDN